MIISEQDKNKLFKLAKSKLGASYRKIQLEESQMLDLLEMSFEDYIEYVNNYIIEHQWLNLLGMDISNDDISRALITREHNIIDQYTYSYSKIVGLGAGEGGYELKKDFVELKKGVQMYQIPAGREINEVLWFTPATLDQSVIDPFLGVWNNQFGAEYIGLGSYYIMPAYDILLRAQDRNLKNRIIRSELTYRITGGPNGTKFLHLMNTPGGRYDFRSSILENARVWYWYYDVNDGDPNACIDANKDIIKSPANVPMENLNYDDLNQPSKNWVRRYFIAECKEVLGRVRGTFSGKVPIPEMEMQWDYQTLLTEANDEKQVLKLEVKERLERLSPEKALERAANEAKNINETLKYRAFRLPFKVI